MTGPHALACAALLPGRVLAAVAGSGTAPFGAAGLGWFAGMTPDGLAGGPGLRLATTLRRQVGAQHRMLSTYLNAFRRHGLVQMSSAESG